MRFELEGATLVSGGRTLWLERNGQRSPAAPLRYEVGRLRDHVEVAGESIDVPRGRGKSLMRFLAEHRLRPAEGVLEVVPHRLVEPREALDARGLAAWLAPGEVVLADLLTSTDAEVESELGPVHTVAWRVVLTGRRAVLLAIGPLGDVRSVAIEHMAIEARTGRDRVVAKGPEGEQTVRTTLTNEDAFAAAAALLPLGPEARLRAVVDQNRGSHRDAAAKLLAHLEGPRAPAERALLEGAELDLDDAFVDALSPEGIVAWAEAWAWDEAQRTALVEALRRRDPASPHARALAEVAWRAARGQDAVAADLRYAALLRDAGDEAAAREVLEASLAELPAPEVAELVPRDDPHAHVAARVRLLEALRPLDPGADARLARIEPLVAARLAPVAERGSAEARRALALLDGGFDAPPRPDDASEPLDDEALGALRHPMGRTDRFASTLQGLLATVETPDLDALRRYCAPLARPDAVRAFERARERLRVDAKCYVSRGEDATGCRAHDDAKGAFLVLGAQHVEDGPLRMSEDELLFVFACELAHLRLGHTRVTQSDMWRGALDKGLSGAELLLMALPLVRQIRIPDSIGTMLGAVKDGTVGKLWDKASGLFGKKEVGKNEAEADEETAESARETLLATHRLMVLSADRVGLAVVGDPGPALRAMFVLQGAADLEGLEREGLAGWVLRRDAKGALVDPDLAVRVTALLSRWLEGGAAAA